MKKKNYFVPGFSRTLLHTLVLFERKPSLDFSSVNFSKIGLMYATVSKHTRAINRKSNCSYKKSQTEMLLSSKCKNSIFTMFQVFPNVIISHFWRQPTVLPILLKFEFSTL